MYDSYLKYEQTSDDICKQFFNQRTKQLYSEAVAILDFIDAYSDSNIINNSIIQDISMLDVYKACCSDIAKKLNLL
ncbi:MAG: hypothetical protein IKN72_01730 [Clostridia bacterium]|nr:hypothetical protein [Clostridia bacterium]